MEAVDAEDRVVCTLAIKEHLQGGSLSGVGWWRRVLRRGMFVLLSVLLSLHILQLFPVVPSSC